MKNLSLVLGALGLILLIASLSMDTSVSVPSGGRVNNLGLMQEQSNYLILSSVIILVAILLFIFGKNSPSKYSQFNDYKKCPKCAEQVRSEAKVCRYCQYQFETVEEEINWSELAARVNAGNPKK